MSQCLDMLQLFHRNTGLLDQQCLHAILHVLVQLGAVLCVSFQHLRDLLINVLLDIVRTLSAAGTNMRHIEIHEIIQRVIAGQEAAIMTAVFDLLHINGLFVDLQRCGGDLHLTDDINVHHQLIKGCRINAVHDAAGLHHQIDAVGLCGIESQHSELAKRFHTDRKTILSVVAVISQLNPNPAQGFGSRESSNFVVPDAFIYSQNDSVTIELNKQALPRISVDEHYRMMLDSADNAELRDYLRQKLRQANDMIQGIQGRGQTLRRLLRYIADYQHAFFCGGELRTMTIQSTAEALETNPSTVSRAVQDKYIQFGGKGIPLRGLFSSSITYGGKTEPFPP